MSPKVLISLTLGIAGVLVALLVVSFVDFVRHGKQSATFQAPPGHLVFKTPTGAMCIYEITAKTVVTVSGQDAEPFRTQASLMQMARGVKNGQVELLCQSTKVVRGSDEQPDMAMYTVSRSPYGLATKWKLMTSDNPMEMFGNGKAVMDPKLPMFDLDLPTLVFPERAVHTGDTWDITGNTKFMHRRILLDGSYLLHYALQSDKTVEKKTYRQVSCRFTFDCPQQTVKKGQARLHEEGTATLLFDEEAGDLFKATFRIERDTEGVWDGKPYHTRARITGVMQRHAEQVSSSFFSPPAADTAGKSQ